MYVGDSAQFSIFLRMKQQGQESSGAVTSVLDCYAETCPQTALWVCSYYFYTCEKKGLFMAVLKVICRNVWPKFVTKVCQSILFL